MVNSELASLATVGLYASLSPYDSGLPLLLAAVAAIAVTVVVGLPARETVIRPLTQGELLSALVMTMGLSLIAESVISTIWDDRPGLFPSLVEGSVSLTDSAIPTQSLQTIVVAVVAVVAAASVACLFGRTTIGSAVRAVAESADPAQILGLGSQPVTRIARARPRRARRLPLRAPGRTAADGARRTAVPRLRRDLPRRSDQHVRRRRRCADSRCADACAGALVSALVFGLTAADTATDMTHGS